LHAFVCAIAFFSKAFQETCTGKYCMLSELHHSPKQEEKWEQVALWAYFLYVSAWKHLVSSKLESAENI
jgi:hypothetical protein